MAAPQRHAAPAAQVNAPEQFNPLVPYAAFGWLPPGFSEGAAAGIDFADGDSASAGYVSLEAADPGAGHLLYLEVSPRGARSARADPIPRRESGRVDDHAAGLGRMPAATGPAGGYR